MTAHHTANSQKPLTYEDSGVSIASGAALVENIAPLVADTRRPGTDAQIGGFGGLFDLKAAGFTDPILVAATDGVGTKLKIAIDTSRHDTIGQDLVAMCVNDLIVQGAEPLFFLDYYATGKLEPDVGAQIVAGIARACKACGCALIGGETAEMPGLYRAGDYDLAGFAVGAVERGAVLPRSDIVAGDVAIGLASSGLHSNGFSLVRKIVEVSGLTYNDAAPFAPAQSLGAALLTPTKLYVKSILALLKQTHGVKALAHVTGGGFPENLPRVLPKNLGVALDLASIPVPPVFAWLAAMGNVPVADMLKTFNCGVGMVVYCAAPDAPAILSALTTLGEHAFLLGTVVECAPSTPRVTYTSALTLETRA